VKRLERKGFWFIIAYGLALPWIVGIGVKLYLQIQGKPTWPWSFFFQPHILLISILCTVWFASPYIGLAFLARFILSARSFFRTGYLERLIIILAGLLWGSVGSVKIFLAIFLPFDPLIFFAFSLPALYGDDMLIGLLGGSVVATVMVLLRKPTSPPKSDLVSQLSSKANSKFRLTTKPRKSWVGGVLNVIPGLGHIYCGRVRQGILMFLFCHIVSVGALLIGLIPHLPYSIFLAIMIFIASRLLPIVHSVLIAKREGVGYELKLYNKWYIYMGIFLFYGLVFQPIIGSLIKSNLVQAYRISSNSMNPTLLAGDHILVDKFMYRIKQLPRGDVIIYIYPKEPSKDFVGRIVALEGDIVEVKDKKLHINGEKYIEDYIINSDSNIFPSDRQPRDNFGPVTVPSGFLFIMGDNRDNSYDSRFWGFLANEKVKGKVIKIYFSWDKDLGSVRWDRIGKIIEVEPGRTDNL